MKKQTITKEQAIELWYKFVESERVSNNYESIGATYAYYELQLKSRGQLIEEIRLLGPVIWGEGREIPKDTTYHELETPYGDFDLTIDELQTLFNAWASRVNRKGTMSVEKLKELL